MVLGELHRRLPNALDFLLHLLDADIGQIAVCPASVPPRAVSGDASACQDVLHLGPSLIIDEWFVGAVVDEFAVADLSRLVGVTQHPVDLAVVQRSADVLDRGATLEAAFVEFISQGRDTPVPCGIGLKSLAKMLGLLLVEGDSLDIFAFDACQRVHVADQGHAVRATPHVFLGNILLGLTRRAAGVELSHSSEYVLHQHTRWCFINLLAHRDEGGPGGLDLGQDHDVVSPVSGKTVELVDDDTVHPAFGHIGQQRLQAFSIRRAGRSPSGDRFTHDLSAKESSDRLGTHGRLDETIRQGGTGVGSAVLDDGSGGCSYGNSGRATSVGSLRHGSNSA